MMKQRFTTSQENVSKDEVIDQYIKNFVMEEKKKKENGFIKKQSM